MWDKVQVSLKDGVTRSKRQLAPRPSKAPTLLRGLVFGKDGRAFTPTYTSKGNRYYRYHINTAAIKIGTHNCDVARVPAGEAEQTRILQTVIERITVRPDGIRIDWKSEGIGQLLLDTLTTRPHSEAA